MADHTLIRRISPGSYGEVWLARSELGAYRAIKIVEPSRFDSSRPFLREYEGIKKFEPVSRSHEGFVDILHVGREVDGNSVYYVMELADDLKNGPEIDPETYRPRTLASEVGLRGPLAPAECIQIGIQLCRTLAFLHDRGLLHRDIKPSNVIFVGNQPKLADIGLVTLIADAKTCVGTIGFIAPEGPNSARSDIFSLGKLLYEISTGLDRNEFPKLPDQTHFSRELLELNEVIVKASNANANERYRDALAMASELEVIATGRSVRRLHYLEAKIQRFRRTGTVVLIAAAIVGLAYHQLNQNAQRRREHLAGLIGSSVARGTSLLRQGDLLGALPSFLDAMQLDDRNEAGRSTHLLRIGSILASTPQIKEWHMPDRPIRSCRMYQTLAVANMERKFSVVIDLDSGEMLSDPIGRLHQPQVASFLPGGEMIVTANWDDTVRIIDWKTNRILETFEHPGTVLAVDVSPDGRRLIAGCRNGQVFLWERDGGWCQELGRHEDLVLGARFSPSGMFAVTTGADATARVWDLDRLVERCRLRHGDWIYGAEFSPDERLVATAGHDFGVRLWNFESGNELEPSLHHEAGVTAVRFSSDGQFLLTACLDGTARLWLAKTHRQIGANHTLKHRSRLFDACFSTDGERILTAGSDGTLTLWDFSHLPPKPELLERRLNRPATETSVSPDGEWRVESNGPQVDVRSKQSPNSIRLPAGGKPGPIQFDEQSSLVCVAIGTMVYLVNLKEGHCRSLHHPNSVTHMRFSPDGQKLVCASADKTLDPMSAQIWNVLTGQPIGAPLSHQDGVMYAAFSPDNRRVITTSEDASAIVWDASSGKRLTPKMRHRAKIYYGEFALKHPWVVTASDDATAIIWDSETGDQLTPPFEHAKHLVKAEFTDDDRSIITTDANGDRWKWRLHFEDAPSRDHLEAVRPLFSHESLAE